MNVDSVLKQYKMHDYKPKADVKALEHFTSSLIHEDYKNELMLRIIAMQNYMVDCPKEELDETRGGIKALQMLEGIFTDLTENRKRDMEAQNEEAL